MDEEKEIAHPRNILDGVCGNYRLCASEISVVVAFGGWTRPRLNAGTS
jgi:hypothetical protein